MAAGGLIVIHSTVQPQTVRVLADALAPGGIAD